METRKPTRMTISMWLSSPSDCAAAIGPGVGGMNTCEVYRPALSATAIATAETPVFLTMALRIGLRMT